MYVCNIVGRMRRKTTLLAAYSFMTADRQSFSQVQQSSKNLQYNDILNITTFMYGSLSQFLKFNQRNGSLPPAGWLISRELWTKQTWENSEFICMVAK